MTKTVNTLPRPITITDMYRKKRNRIPFDGQFRNSFGQPEKRGSWLIWSPPTNGKTRLCLQLAKYLTEFGKVLYDSLEEGDSVSIEDSCRAVQMEDVKSRIHFLDMEPIPVLRQRLALRNSADFVFIDSIQYTFMDTAQYKALLADFPNKLFIFTSHAKGKDPKGSLAESVWYDANVKIWVEGYRAFPKSRYGGEATYDIWPERAAQYWNDTAAEHAPL